jgi:hypothetical protein
MSEGKEQIAAGQEPARGHLNRRLGITAVVMLLLIAGAFVAGNVLGDDSDEVADLEKQVAELSDDLQDSESELDFTEEELDLTEGQRRNLASQLKAEESLSGDIEELTDGSGSAPDSDYLAGVAGTVGQFVMKPTIEMGSSSGEEATWFVTIEAQNNGSSPVEMFCTGSEVTVVDSLGRSYDGEGVLAEDTANCGDAIQPGLTIDNFVVEFTLPSGAEPALIEIAGGEYGEGPSKSWAVEPAR